MSELPVVERELRIAARAGGTYRSRRNFAALALFLFVLLYWNFGKMGPWAFAKIFSLLSLVCYVYCLFSGLILTADSISSEKREGTLGLLFLTALKPAELVLGNLLATSLKAVYGLLAAFPVLGITLLLGGVEYRVLGRVCLALLSALGLSLSLSLFVSCWSEKYLAAIGRTAVMLILLALGLPGIATGVLQTTGTVPEWLRVANLFSPTTALNLAQSSSLALRDDFGWSLLAVNSASIALLAGSCLSLPHVWRDRVTRRWWGRREFTRWKARSALGNWNPFYWLASRGSRESVKFLLVALLFGVVAVICSHFNPVGLRAIYPELTVPLFFWSWALAGLHLLLLYKFAALATSRLAEDRKLGALELILVTPSTVRDMLWGQWGALWRQLAGPVLAVLFLHGLILWAFLTLTGMQGQIGGGAWGVFKHLLREWNREEWRYWSETSQIGIVCGSAVILIFDWFAIGWAGMWIALRTRKPILAPWLTLALVLFPPVAIFFTTIAGGVSLGFTGGDASFWVPFFVVYGFCLAVGHASVVIAYCWFQIQRRFRECAAERFSWRSQQSLRGSALFLGRIAGAAGALALLVALFYTEEKWRGMRAWRQVEREYAARGEVLRIRLLAPPPIPDEQNFAAGAMLRPLFNYKYDSFGQLQWGDKDAHKNLMTLTVTSGEPFTGSISNEPLASWRLQQKIDLSAWAGYYSSNVLFAARGGASPAAAVLQALSLFDEELNELETLSQRPFCQFPIHYEEGFGALLAHLGVLKNVSQIIRLRAVAHLELGDIQAARSDVAFILRLAGALRSGPALYSLRTRELILGAALQPIWEGLHRHVWSENDLSFFEHELQIDLLSEYPGAVRDQIAGAIEFWEEFARPNLRLFQLLGGFPAGLGAARIYPQGWKYLNQSGLVHLCDETLLPMVDAKAHRVFPKTALGIAGALRGNRVAIDPVSRSVIPYQSQNFRESILNTAQCQASVDQALIAFALERWWITHGSYPPSLSALGSILPRDVTSGDAYRYRLLPDRRFLLYSVGWNERDDLGVAIKGHPEEGDWVWTYPEKDQKFGEP